MVKIEIILGIYKKVSSLSYRGLQNRIFCHLKLKCMAKFSHLTPLFVLICGRYTEILEDFKKDPESHGGPPDGIVSHITLFHRYFVVYTLPY